jgi:hypothetical protein
VFLTIAIVAVSLGAFFDGLTTNFAIKRGAHEIDPLMVRIFQTATPTAKTVYVRGGICIGLESALALTFGHFWPHVGFGVAVALCAQATMHFYETIRTLKNYSE